MALSYPIDCTTPRERTEYCYRFQELLRVLHNFMVAWRAEGKTEAQWNKLPNKVKTRYPYKANLTDQEVKDFINTLWRPMNQKVCNQIGIQRRLLFESIVWTPNPDDLIDD